MDFPSRHFGIQRQELVFIQTAYYILLHVHPLCGSSFGPSTCIKTIYKSTLCLRLKWFLIGTCFLRSALVSCKSFILCCSASKFSKAGRGEESSQGNVQLVACPNSLVHWTQALVLPAAEWVRIPVVTLVPLSTHSSIIASYKV